MTISGIPTTRVSDIYTQHRLLAQLQSDQVSLANLQEALSTGYAYQLPSEAPAASSRVLSLQRLATRQGQFSTNLTSALSYLSETDSTLGSVSDLMTGVRADVLSVIGSASSDTERQSVASEVTQTVSELLDIGNTQFRGRYLFSGSATTIQAYSAVNSYIRFNGNEGSVTTVASTSSLVTTSVSGSDVFGGISDSKRGTAVLTPALEYSTSLSSLNSGDGVTAGSIVISDGNTTTTIDLSGATTIEQVAALIQAKAFVPTDPLTLQTDSVTVEVTSTGLKIQASNSSANLTITEVGNGTTAHDLGIYVANGSGTEIDGSSLDPCLEESTPLADLLGTRSRAFFHPTLGSDNSFYVESDTNGSTGDGLTISLINDNTVTSGNEYCVYDTTANTLVVHMVDGQSTANNVCDAINNSVIDTSNNPIDLAYTATIDPLLGSNGGEGALYSSGVATVTTANGSGTNFDTTGLQIVNGGQTYEVSFDSCTTIQDMLNALNGSDMGLCASINDSGTGIDIRTRLSGCDFEIGENGGNTATQLGVRTFDEDTSLTALNYGKWGYQIAEATANGAASADDLRFGRGETVTSADDTSPDFTVTRQDGTVLTIDVRTASTIGDVLDLINNNANNSDGLLVAQLSTQGNGIELVDTSIGTGNLIVTRDETSTAAIELGLVAEGSTSTTGTSTGTGSSVLTGADANPQETSGIYTALIRLQEGLTSQDSWTLTRATAMLDDGTTTMNFVRSEVGVREQSVNNMIDQLADQSIQVQAAISNDYEADFTTVVSQLAARETAYKASLQVTSILLQMSLLNYL